MHNFLKSENGRRLLKEIREILCGVCVVWGFVFLCFFLFWCIYIWSNLQVNLGNIKAVPNMDICYQILKLRTTIQ